MPKVNRYRIYPTKSQITKLNDTLELCRWVYNETLALRKNAWESEQKRISYYDSKKMIPVWKKDKPELKTVHSHTLQDVTMRVDLAFQAFFRRFKAGEKAGYPRFKGKGWYDSITYLQSGFSLNGNILNLSKIGDIKIKLHRPLEGNIKRLTIRRTSTGKWFVSILADVETYQPLEHFDKSVGIDVGILSFATLSNGTYVPNPRFYIQEEKALARANRKLSKAEKGTSERMKCLKTLCRVYERITNKREDFTQKLSKELVDNYGIICFEDLNIKNMSKNHNLAKHILDAAWSKLVTYTSYKAENAGRKVVLVDPKNTSKMCSNCGMLVEKDLQKELITVLSVAYLLTVTLMLLLIFSDWDYSLFVKPIDAPHFNEGSSHSFSLNLLYLAFLSPCLNRRTAAYASIKNPDDIIIRWQKIPLIQ